MNLPLPTEIQRLSIEDGHTIVSSAPIPGPDASPDGNHRSVLSAVRRYALVGVGGLLALTARWPLLPFETRDYYVLRSWRDFIHVNGGFAALQHDFSAYNPPYLYLLAASSYLDPWLSAITATKAISIVFDFVLAYFVFLAVRLRYPAPSLLPIWAALAILFAPAVVMNSAMWSQADAIYTAFLAGSLYCLLKGRQARAFVLYGLSFSFKLQAVFFAPVLFWLLAKGEARWRDALWIPLVALLALVPAWLLGRPWIELASPYLGQITGERRSSSSLSGTGMTLYIWISTSLTEWSWQFVGIAAIALLLLTDFLLASRRTIHDRLPLLAAFSVIFTPFILPFMHERYFYPAETLSVILAFYYPRYWFVPPSLWLVSAVTYFRYLDVLRASHSIPREWLSFGMLVVVIFLGLRVLRDFRDGAGRLRGSIRDQ